MIEILEGTRPNVVATKAVGKLTKEDYDRLLPLLRKKVDKHGNLRWYFEMDKFVGWEPEAAYKDMKFDFKNADTLEKVAMVGAKKWEKMLTQVMKPFTTADVRFFEISQKQEALSWIEE